MVKLPMNILRDSFSFVRILTVLSLTFPDKADLPDFTNDTLHHVNVIVLMYLQHSFTEVMYTFIDSMPNLS